MQRVIGARVGIFTNVSQYSNGTRKVPCARCGAERTVPGLRKVHMLCRDCRDADPLWGVESFDRLPTSDSNTCAFDEPYDDRNARRRASRARRNREGA